MKNNNIVNEVKNITDIEPTLQNRPSEVQDIVANTTKINMKSPEPLRRQLPPSAEFPIDSLPEIVKEAVLALHDKIQAPIALCVQSVLAVANLTVQGHVNIMMPFGESKPISCYFLTIAASGERKTSADNAVLKTVKAYEKKLKKQHKIDLQAWENECAAWTKMQETIVKEHKKLKGENNFNASKGILTEKLNELGAKPKSPLTPLIICAEPTFEGLCKLMITSRPSLGIFCSEGGQFVGGYSMSPDHKIRTAAALSEMWDGESVKRVRGGDGTTSLDDKRLSMHLMVQPNIGTNFLSDAALKDQGLFSRLLISYPLTTVGTRFQRETNPNSEKALNRFNQVIDDILRLPFPIQDGSTNELEPRVIAIEGKALKLYKDYCDQIEENLACDKPFEPIKGFASKLPEHACRIAATLAAFDDINVETLEYQYIRMGIEIVSYYAEEALRLFNNGVINPDIILAEKLLHWLHNNWGEEYISLPDVYQRGLSAISTKPVASKIMAILEDHRCIEEIKGGMVIGGKNRREVWKIIKE